ncbi:MAG: ABC transporter ATP-binding protein, partial [Candidatus Zixiibacteriota bacterium]
MTETPVDNAAGKGRFTLLVRYLRQYRRYLWWGAMAVVFANILSLINPYLIKVVFDRLEHKAPMRTVGQLLLLMVLLETVAGLFRFLMRRTIIWMSRHIEYHLRNDLVRHLLTLPVSFFDKSRTGDIMARATNDIEAVRMMVGPAIMQGTNTIVTIAVAVPFMIYLSPRLTMYALLPALVFPFLMQRMGKMVHQRFMKIQQHFATLTAAAQENLSGIRLIKAYRQEAPETEHFSNLSSKYVDLNMSLARVMAVFMPVVMLLAGLLGLVVLYFGGKDVINGRIPLGTIVAFFIYLTRLMWPMMAIGWVVNLYQRGSASLDRLNTIMNTPPEIAVGNTPRHAEQIRGEVEFRHLQFAYDGAPVLR